MRSKLLGKNILSVEVTNISKHGFWLFVDGKEFFLSYDEHPWFKDAKVGDILDVELLHQSHLYWPKLDVDLELAALADASRYPLTYK